MPDGTTYIAETDTVLTIEVSCNYFHTRYPYSPNGAKCPGFNWCENNFRVDENNNACAQFDNCVVQGDGTGDFDSAGQECSKNPFFDEAKALFDE